MHSALDEKFWFDIREELRRSDTEIFPDDSIIPDEVTHFTSLAGLEGIITKQEIWCTDLREVDDKHECDYGMTVIQRVIAAKPSVPEQFSRAVMSANNLFGVKDRFTYFISCFCSSHNEPRMWDDYADGSRGFAIVFDAKRLLAAADGGKEYSFTPVIYNEKIQNEKAAKVIDHAIWLQHEKGLTASELKRYWSKEVQYCLLLCGFRFKAPCWQHQLEFRIAKAESDSLKPFVHAGKTRVAIPFNHLPIIRIIRGPMNTETGATERLRKVLNQAGYGASQPIL
jgi:hypothetical protein